MDAHALDRVVDLVQAALVMTLKLSLPLLGVGLVVGLAVSLIHDPSPVDAIIWKSEVLPNAS